MLKKRTPIGNFIHSSWTNLNIRVGNGKYHYLATEEKCKHYENISLLFTREEYKKLCLAQASLILSLRRPSLDRKNPAKDYTIDNIHFIELDENIRKDKTVFDSDSGTGLCSMCRKQKEINSFAKDHRRFAGRSSICKACDNGRKRKK